MRSLLLPGVQGSGLLHAAVVGCRLNLQAEILS
jgi:hypothetical protein